MTLFSQFFHVEENKVVGGPDTPFSRNLPQPQTSHSKPSDLSLTMMLSLVMGSDKNSVSSTKAGKIQGTNSHMRARTHTHTHTQSYGSGKMHEK